MTLGTRSRQGLQEGPIARPESASATSDDQLTSGRSCLICADFACELRLQCDLAALRHSGRDRGSSMTLAPRRRGPWKPCRRRPRRQEASARPSSARRRSGTMTPSSDTEALTASVRVRPSASRPCCSSVSGREGLPALVHGPCQALAGCNTDGVIAARSCAKNAGARGRDQVRVTHHQQTELSRRLACR